MSEVRQGQERRGNTDLVLQKVVGRETQQWCWKGLRQTGEKQIPCKPGLPRGGASFESFEMGYLGPAGRGGTSLHCANLSLPLVPLNNPSNTQAQQQQESRRLILILPCVGNLGCVKALGFGCFLGS